MVVFWRKKVKSKKNLNLRVEKIVIKYSSQQLLIPLDCSFRLKLLVRGFDFLLVTAVAEAFCHTGYKFEHSVTMRVSTRAY